MKIFKLDIYQKEWLDIIFSNRNQAYGAYELRKTASSSMKKAMIGVLSAVGVVVGSMYVFGQKEMSALQPNNADQLVTITEVDLDIPDDEIIEPLIPETIEKDEAPQQLAEDLPAEDLIRFPEAIIVDAASVKEDLASQEDIKGKMTARLTLRKVPDGTSIPKGEFGTRKREGEITGIRNGSEHGGNGDSDVPFVNVQIMPEPIGGMSAFIKWVADNYQFPSSALNNGVQGVIEVTFVVEKDGSLTDISVKRDMGYGTGEEAVKLLKRAKKWNAGIQNGRPVRVAYTMPIRLSSVSQ